MLKAALVEVRGAVLSAIAATPAPSSLAPGLFGTES
jgi:hypothetical protein